MGVALDSVLERYQIGRADGYSAYQYRRIPTIDTAADHQATGSQAGTVNAVTTPTGSTVSVHETTGPLRGQPKTPQTPKTPQAGAKPSTPPLTQGTPTRFAGNRPTPRKQTSTLQRTR